MACNPCSCLRVQPIKHVILCHRIVVSNKENQYNCPPLVTQNDTHSCRIRCRLVPSFMFDACNSTVRQYCNADWVSCRAKFETGNGRDVCRLTHSILSINSLVVERKSDSRRVETTFVFVLLLDGTHYYYFAIINLPEAGSTWETKWQLIEFECVIVVAFIANGLNIICMLCVTRHCLQTHIIIIIEYPIFICVSIPCFILRWARHHPIETVH